MFNEELMFNRERSWRVNLSIIPVADIILKFNSDFNKMFMIMADRVK